MRDPSSLSAPARELALARLAARLTQEPWTAGTGEIEALSAAGVSDEGLVQVVTIAAVFNHLTRVADGTGVEPDYASPLPRLQVDAGLEPTPRPEPHDWPARSGAPRLTLALRPATEEAIRAWRAYVRTPSAALSTQDRAVLGRAVAFGLCDAAGVSAWGGAEPGSARESALATYAEALTLTPWRVTGADLEPLRRQGLDDRGLLDVMGLVGFQNMESRVRLALG